jgi:hypothetical protein
MVSRSLLALAALFVCLCPQAANAQIKGYTVQIAALRSQQSADELTKGLTARGIDAYWIRGARLGARFDQKHLYRVRIGKFNTIENAYGYAERLLDSGLLDAYAIAAYELPKAQGNSPDEVPSKVQSFTSRKESGNETIDLIAAIGRRGWLLLSSRSVLSTPRQNNSALSRELARLAASIGSRGWRLNNNLARILPPPVQAAPVASPIRSVDLASKSPLPIDAGAPGIAPVPPVARANSTNTSAPEIGRRPLSPSTSGGNATGARGAAYAAPPRLQGTIELRDGRMWMRLRNTDADRPFTGLARITLSDEKSQQDVAPVQFTLSPDREESFPVDEAKVTSGNWILMVYDENGAARLVRGASLALKQAPQNTVVQNAADPNQPAQGPPSYVTGVYDATSGDGWTLSQTPTANGQPQNNGLVPLSGNQNSAGANAQSDDGNPAPAPPAEIAPGQVTVIPRQIAITTENLTMEFDLSAPRPLNYIVVTLRAGQYQDTRQALMSTPVGRVPFLVPVQHTSQGFYYEIKDEAQRVLASGNGDFRSLGRGN